MRTIVIGYEGQEPFLKLGVKSINIDISGLYLEDTGEESFAKLKEKIGERKLKINYSYTSQELTIDHYIDDFSESAKLADIRFCLRGANEAGGFDRSPALCIKSLGVDYKECDTSMASFSDCLIFRGCSNIPSNLPSFIKVVDMRLSDSLTRGDK